MLGDVSGLTQLDGEPKDAVSAVTQREQSDLQGSGSLQEVEDSEFAWVGWVTRQRRQLETYEPFTVWVMKPRCGFSSVSYTSF